MLVSIIGTMGIGKSTILDLLDDLDENRFRLFYEPLPETDNFILEYFYKDPVKWAFTMQSLMLGLHLDIQKRALEASNQGFIAVMDSSLYCGKAYVDTQYQNNIINEIEYKAYERLYSITSSIVRKPDIIFMLDAPFEQILSRVHNRNRSCEEGVDESYLMSLHNNYKSLATEMESRFNVVYIDGAKDKFSVLNDILSILEES